MERPCKLPGLSRWGHCRHEQRSSYLPCHWRLRGRLHHLLRRLLPLQLQAMVAEAGREEGVVLQHLRRILPLRLQGRAAEAGHERVVEGGEKEQRDITLIASFAVTFNVYGFVRKIS